jgi:hypothetical protein
VVFRASSRSFSGLSHISFSFILSYFIIIFFFFFKQFTYLSLELRLLFNITLLNTFASGKGQCGTMYVRPYVQPTGPFRISTAPYNISSLDYRFIVACV